MLTTVAVALADAALGEAGGERDAKAVAVGELRADTLGVEAPDDDGAAENAALAVPPGDALFEWRPVADTLTDEHAREVNVPVLDGATERVGDALPEPLPHAEALPLGERVGDALADADALALADARPVPVPVSDADAESVALGLWLALALKVADALAVSVGQAVGRTGSCDETQAGTHPAMTLLQEASGAHTADAAAGAHTESPAAETDGANPGAHAAVQGSDVATQPSEAAS